MNVKFNHIHFFFGLLTAALLTCFSASAQYENESAGNELKEQPQNPETLANDEKPIVFEHERSSKIAKDSSTSHYKAPSQAVTPKIKPAEHAKPSSTKEDDALSFNFLYYIIQKYKISDLVDE